MLMNQQEVVEVLVTPFASTATGCSSGGTVNLVSVLCPFIHFNSSFINQPDKQDTGWRKKAPGPSGSYS